ncbi:hypothetical protein LINGRAHAP2_LOCUS22929, partial [Linum grandiflorum]
MGREPRPHHQTQKATSPRKEEATTSASTKDKASQGHMRRDCPNKSTMVIRDGEVGTDDEADPEENESKKDEEEAEDIVEIPQGRQLQCVATRLLNAQYSTNLEQRENLFYTRCLINTWVSSLIIDGGSCTNVASEVMIEKLGLPTTSHPKVYKLQWLDQNKQLTTMRQVLLSFS